MKIIWVILILAIFSILAAIRDAKRELSVPHWVRNIKIKKKKNLSGVILFLRQKIKHYSSDSS